MYTPKPSTTSSLSETQVVSEYSTGQLACHCEPVIGAKDCQRLQITIYMAHLKSKEHHYHETTCKNSSFTIPFHGMFIKQSAQRVFFELILSLFIIISFLPDALTSAQNRLRSDNSGGMLLISSPPQPTATQPRPL